MSINCSNCPCLNNDADYGRSCNLGYKVKDSMFGASSLDCKLSSVKYTDDSGKVVEFIPEED